MSTNHNSNKGGPKMSGESKKIKKPSSPVSTKGLNHYGVYLDKTESESVLALQIMMAVAKANGEKTSIKGKNATMTLAKYRAESVVGVLKNKPWREFFDANKIENVDDRNTPGRHPVPGEQILLSNKNNSFNPSRSRNENLLSTDSILTSFSTASAENVGNSAPIPSGIDRESKAIRMIRRIQVLWDELKIPNDDRNFYLSTLCQLEYPCPSVEQMNELTKHIVMLLHHRKATIEVLKQIENRELLLKKTLKNLVGIQKKSFAALTDVSSYTWKKELLQLFVDLQIATLVVIHRIQMWRRNLWRPFPFIWKKINYINKIKSDLELLDTDFFRNLLDSFPLAKKDLLCLVFESPEDWGSANNNNNNNNKEKSTTNNTYPTPSNDDIEEGKDLRSFFISSGTTLYRKELQAAARVIQEESLLQCALKVEHEALRTRGVFIPTLRVETSSTMMQDSQEDSLEIHPVDGGLHSGDTNFYRDGEEEEEDMDHQEPVNRNTRKSQPESESEKKPPPASTSSSSHHTPASKEGNKSPNNPIDYKMLAFQSDKLSSDEIDNAANSNNQEYRNDGRGTGGDGDNLRERLNELSTHSNSASLTGVANFLPFDPVDPLEASEAGDTDIDLDDLLDVSLDPNETAENSDDDM